MTEKKIELTFQKISGQAVLIGDKISMLDNDLNEISDASDLQEGKIVATQEISDSLFNNSEDYCDAFKYVRVKADSKSGLIDGRNVYKIEQNEQNASFKIDNQTFKIMTTSFFGIGVSDEDGLTFCSKYSQPIVIKNMVTENFSLVHLKKNSLTEKASWNKDFSFFELRADDGAYDKIIEIHPAEEGVVLTIHREFQEGSNEYEVTLTPVEGGYQAEYIRYGEIQY